MRANIRSSDSLRQYSNQNPRGAIPSPALDIAKHLENKDLRARAFRIKSSLVAMAEAHLPEKMGRVYTNVVLACLTCLDPNNQGFGDEAELTDKDGIMVGVRYIEKVSYTISASCYAYKRQILYQIEDISF